MLTTVIGDVHTIDDVVAAMRAIEAALPENDGVRWFNVLYRRVTEAVQAEGALWEDWPFLQRFDVAFARLYFEAIIAWESNPDRAPRAWRPLFQARGNDKLMPLQFALAGMNAHINNDLVLALDRIARSEQQYPSREGQRYRDFQRVNDVLERVEVELQPVLSTGVDCCDRRGARRSRHDSCDVESPARPRYGVDERRGRVASACRAAPPERVPHAPGSDGRVCRPRPAGAASGRRKSAGPVFVATKNTTVFVLLVAICCGEHFEMGQSASWPVQSASQRH